MLHWKYLETRKIKKVLFSNFSNQLGEPEQLGTELGQLGTRPNCPKEQIGTDLGQSGTELGQLGNVPNCPLKKSQKYYII